MMDFWIQIIPGLAISCAFFLLAVAIVQWRVYSKTGYQRSKVLMWCALASIMDSLGHFVAQSRLFSDYFTLLSVYVVLCFFYSSMILYLRALSYYVAVPSRLFKFYSAIFSLLTVYSFSCLIYFVFTGEDIYFKGDNPTLSSNYFVNSYTQRFGNATGLLTISCALSAIMAILVAIVMLYRVFKSSRDKFFIAGLLLTIFCNVRETLILPFTVEYYVPFIYLGNIFEVFRMNVLSYREYVSEQISDARKKAGPETNKYQNSNLTEERIQELGSELHTLLEREELYLNPNLSSEDLAKALGIPAYQLSQVINIGLGKTFFELLSEYRIKKVIEKLKDPEQASKTIIDIAYETGFNSKSSFNTSFKKLTGLTPSAFRKQVVNE